MSANQDDERPEAVFHRELEELRRRLAAARAAEKTEREANARLRTELAELLERLRRSKE